MKNSIVLFVDAVVNLALGVLLVAFPKPLVDALGLPPTDDRFYPSILGAVLFGIGVALLVECRRQDRGLVGLGLGGAVAINLIGGLCLAGWLLVGNLTIPQRGLVILWLLVGLLIAISACELFVHARMRRAGH